MKVLLMHKLRLPFFLLALSAATALHAETLTLRRAVELALAHSPDAALAAADLARAQAGYRETRAAYLPMFVLGSGVGKSWGFPLSLENAAPSIVNFNTQSTLFNPALREFVRAAKTDTSSADLQAKDRRDQVMQDTVLNFLELVRWQSQIDQLQTEQSSARQAEQAVEERIREGVDNPVERSKARLATARLRMRLAEAQGSADVLKLKLSQATGLPVAEIEVGNSSIPSLPSLENQNDAAFLAASNNPAVKGAEEHAIAQAQRARGEHRGMWPSVDFAGQYALLSKYNNYDQFFNRFERHNGTLGVVMRFPFLSFAQRARAEGADAEALKAKKQADLARQQVSAETLRLQRAIQQLAAARDVASLEYDVAKSSLETVQIRDQSGTAGFHDLEQARMEARERQNQLLDAELQLQRAQVGLLRSTGQLENWVMGKN